MPLSWLNKPEFNSFDASIRILILIWLWSVFFLARGEGTCIFGSNFPLSLISEVCRIILLLVFGFRKQIRKNYKYSSVKRSSRLFTFINCYNSFKDTSVIAVQHCSELCCDCDWLSSHRVKIKLKLKICLHIHHGYLYRAHGCSHCNSL